MIKTYGDRQPGLGTSAIVGALTLAKTGTTARTATFPDAAITVAGSASALTSGRVPFATTGGLLTDSALMLFASAQLTLGDNTTAGAIVINGASGATKAITTVQRAGVTAWGLFVRDATDDYRIRAYDDAGAAIDYPLTIVRAAGGAITLARPVTCTGAVTVPNGTAAAPGIRTTTYAHGLHSIGATSVGIDVAGALVLTVGATASSFASGTTVQFSNTTTAGNGTGSVICNGGGYFAKAVFAANDASGVHYYGNAGLTMRDQGSATTTYLDLAFGSASHGAYSIRSSSGATVRFNIDTSGHVTLGGASGNYLNINNATGELRVNGTKVITAQGAAVADATGAGDVVAQLNALLARCRAHGLIAT